MAQFVIDFNTLKYNLYEILNVDKTASENKIKKAFRNLILNFHPDKNSEAESEIYYHIVTANQVLTNKESRKNYDEFISKQSLNYDDLKNNFMKEKERLEAEPPVDKEEQQKSFNARFKELETHHLGNFTETTNLMEKFESMKRNRENDISIPKEDIKGSDFNSLFEKRINGGHFSNQLIVTPEKSELSITNINDNYTSLDLAFNNLYIDGGGISTSKYTSLDSAFKIQPINRNYVEKPTKTSIESYNEFTNSLSDIKYTNEKFETW